MRPLIRLYAPMIRESIVAGVGETVDWEAAERRFPECSAAWDRDTGGEDLEVLVVLPLAGGTLVAAVPGQVGTYWYIDGRWRPHGVNILQNAGFVILDGAVGRVYFRRVRSGANPEIQVAAPPENTRDIPGAVAPARPNGQVSAVVPPGAQGPETVEAVLGAIEDSE